MEVIIQKQTKMRQPLTWDLKGKWAAPPTPIHPHTRKCTALFCAFILTQHFLQFITVSCYTCFLRARLAAHCLFPELEAYDRLFAQMTSITAPIPVCMPLCNVTLLRLPWWSLFPYPSNVGLTVTCFDH